MPLHYTYPSFTSLSSSFLHKGEYHFYLHTQTTGECREDPLTWDHSELGRKSPLGSEKGRWIVACRLRACFGRNLVCVCACTCVRVCSCAHTHVWICIRIACSLVGKLFTISRNWQRSDPFRVSKAPNVKVPESKKSRALENNVKACRK